MGNAMMTDEQIKQNAERYAKLENCKGIDYPRYLGFVAGAHSLDDEIERLQNQIEELSDQLKMNAENIQKLRNPWISVEERKPKKSQRVVVCSVHRNGVYRYAMAQYNGWRFLYEDRGFVPKEIVPCVKYWQPASGWIEKGTKCVKNE